MALSSRAFFSASPREVIDDLVNHVNLCAADALEGLERKLRDEEVCDAESIKLGVDQFQLKFQRTVDTKMSKLEEYALRNIFRVPDDLVLPPRDERAGAQQPHGEPLALLDEELVQMAERIQAAIATRRALVAELRQLHTEVAAQAIYAPLLAPVASLAPGADDALSDGDVRLRAALRLLERNVDALDQIRSKILSRLSHAALAADADALASFEPAIKTGDLEDLACLSRTLRAMR
jgi:hypothetical protein